MSDLIDGVLIIDKPAGLTSHDVVARLRRILRTKRIGHTGTLDPFATGVLVMLVGKATRLARFLDKDTKEYEAVVRLGFATNTGDLTGSPKSKVQSPKQISIVEIENILPDFLGEIEQTPPMYSAKKIDGKKLYELARKGIEVERKPAQVTIYKLEIMHGEDAKIAQKSDSDFGLWTLDFGLLVSCSAGTYIRTLAEDIGAKVGVGAHLAELRRIRAGKFDLSKVVTLEELETIVAAEKLSDVLISMNEAINHLPPIILNDAEIEKTRRGMRVEFVDESIADNQTMRMIDAAENLIAVGFYTADEKTVQPKIVLV